MKTKKFFSTFNAIRLINDIILIPFIVIAAYTLKFKVGWIAQNLLNLEYGTIYQHAQVEPYISLILISILLIPVTFYLVGVYGNRDLIFPEVDDIIKIIKGMTIICLEIMALTFLVNFVPESRFVILYMWMIGIITYSITHYLIHKTQVKLLKSGNGCKKAIVIGSDELAQDLIEKLIIFPAFGFRYIGSISENKPRKIHFHLKSTYNHLGTFNKLKKIIKENNIDVIFYMNPFNADSIYKEIVTICHERKIELKQISDIARLEQNSLMLQDIDGLPFIVSSESKAGWVINRAIKRILDIVISTGGLIVLSPILVFTMISIKIVSPKGPSLYSQDRVGKNGRIFKMHKFRTMVPNAEKSTGPIMVKEKNENRYHSIGKILRKSSIDELPQLWNIIKGDMSIIGPRPERPFFVEKFKKEIPNFHKRHSVKGGLTGWAQVNGRSVLTNNPKHKIKYDLYYINNWSLTLDIKIFLKTFSVVFSQEEAY